MRVYCTNEHIPDSSCTTHARAHTHTHTHAHAHAHTHMPAHIHTHTPAHTHTHTHACTHTHTHIHTHTHTHAHMHTHTHAHMHTHTHTHAHTHTCTHMQYNISEYELSVGVEQEPDPASVQTLEKPDEMVQFLAEVSPYHAVYRRLQSGFAGAAHIVLCLMYFTIGQ